MVTSGPFLLNGTFRRALHKVVIFRGALMTLPLCEMMEHIGTDGTFAKEIKKARLVTKPSPTLIQRIY